LEWSDSSGSPHGTLSPATQNPEEERPTDANPPTLTLPRQR
jgi:hypothetical protein